MFPVELSHLLLYSRYECLLDVDIENTPMHSLFGLFTLLIVSFGEQFLNLNITKFIVLHLHVLFKKYLPNQGHKNSLLYFIQ